MNILSSPQNQFGFLLSGEIGRRVAKAVRFVALEAACNCNIYQFGVQRQFIFSNILSSRHRVRCLLSNSGLSVFPPLNCDI